MDRKGKVQKQKQSNKNPADYYSTEEKMNRTPRPVPQPKDYEEIEY
ncbi:hypothetical protein [Halobacillus seohaensis]|uniref:Uncharacterized protein n=1 Tax=Halobacillus seohaensis TaxID=447421 RepID=A0ABW2EGB8_9BACI